MAFIKGAYGDLQAVAPSILPYEELEDRRKDRVAAAKQLHQQRVDAVNEQVYEKNLSQGKTEFDKINYKIAPIYQDDAQLLYDEYMTEVLDVKSKSSNSFDPNADYNKAAQKLGVGLERYEQMSAVLSKNMQQIKDHTENYDPEAVDATRIIENANATGKNIRTLGDELHKIPNVSGSYDYDPEKGVMVNPVTIVNDPTTFFHKTVEGNNKLPIDTTTLTVTKDPDSGAMYYVTKPSEKTIDDRVNQVVQSNGVQSPLFRRFIAENRGNPIVWNTDGKAPIGEDGKYTNGSGGMSINYDNAMPLYKKWVSGYINNSASQKVDFVRPVTPAEKLATEKFNTQNAEHSYEDLQRHATQLENNAKYWKSKEDAPAISGFGLSDEDKKDFKDNYTNYVSTINNVVSQFHDNYTNTGQKISFEQFDEELKDNGVPQYFINIINQQGKGNTGTIGTKTTAQQAASEFGGTVR